MNEEEYKVFQPEYRDYRVISHLPDVTDIDGNRYCPKCIEKGILTRLEHHLRQY